MADIRDDELIYTEVILLWTYDEFVVLLLYASHRASNWEEDDKRGPDSMKHTFISNAFIQKLTKGKAAFKRNISQVATICH